MNKLLFVVFLFIQILRVECYELSVCTIFQNDAKWLPEWIQFHSDNGVEHFYLYSNLSTDNYKEILNPYIKAGIVDLIEWPYTYNTGDEWTKIQCWSYLHCVTKIWNKDKWCAFLDTDEFLFSPTDKDIKVTLREFHDCVAIGVNWVMYGTSHVEKIPDGEKMLDYLVWRSDLDFVGNDTPKSIVRPKYVENCINPHSFIMKNGLPTLNENRIQFPPSFSMKNSVKKLRINHYWSRDKNFFYNIKIPRRIKWYGDAEEQIKLESQMNEVFDPIISN